jgi:hypothetical protein
MRIDGPDEFGWIGKCGVSRINLDHGENSRRRNLSREMVSQFLLNHVADHTLGLGIQHVQGIGFDCRIAGSLESKQADLRPVPVRENELMIGCQGCQCPGCCTDILPLYICRHRLPPFQQGVSTQGDDNSHG